jgi:hypothetical protein
VSLQHVVNLPGHPLRADDRSVVLTSSGSPCATDPAIKATSTVPVLPWLIFMNTGWIGMSVPERDGLTSMGWIPSYDFSG